MEFIAESNELLPEGDYTAEIDGAQEKASKRTPNVKDMIEIKLIVSDGKGTSNVVYDYIARWNVKEFKTALGESVATGQRTNVQADELSGITLRVHLIQEAYNGTTRNKVSKYLPAPVKPTLNEHGEPDDVTF